MFGKGYRMSSIAMSGLFLQFDSTSCDASETHAKPMIFSVVSAHSFGNYFNVTYRMCSCAMLSNTDASDFFFLYLTYKIINFLFFWFSGLSSTFFDERGFHFPECWLSTLLTRNFCFIPIRLKVGDFLNRAS